MNAGGGTALIVLGAAVWPGGRPSPTLARRIAHAASVWRDHPGAWVIGTGGVGRHGPAEARVICAELAARGLPAERLLREERSTSTLENIAFSVPILARRRAVRVLIVTDGWHMARALMTARAFGLSAEGRPVPAAPDMSRRRQAAAHLREAIARPVYRWRLARVTASRR